MEVTVHIPKYVERLWDWVDDPRLGEEELQNDKEYDIIVIKESENFNN